MYYYISEQKKYNTGISGEDIGLRPENDSIDTELIMDGRIMRGNLKRMGLDETWLKKQLKLQGLGRPSDIFLAVCGSDLKLSVYGME